MNILELAFIGISLGLVGCLIILIHARKMSDDYAEKIWIMQRKEKSGN